MNQKHRTSSGRESANPFEQARNPIFDDPKTDGIQLSNLRKGTPIRIETAVVKGYGLIIDIELVNPASGAVKILNVIQKSPSFKKTVRPSEIGIDTPVVVLRCFRALGELPVTGWLGLNCSLALSSVTISQPVRAIYINGAMIFPQSNTSLLF